MTNIISNIVCNNLNEIIRDNIDLINELILNRNDQPNALYISNPIRYEFPRELQSENILVYLENNEIIFNYGLITIKRLSINNISLNNIHDDIRDNIINVN